MPTPDAPEWVNSRPFASQFQGEKGEITATIAIRLWWPPVSGSNISYTIQELSEEQHDGEDWVTIASNITDSSVRIGWLKTDTEYSFQVRAETGSSPDIYSDWTEHSLETPHPFVGHQADHTVQYVIGTGAPTFPSWNAPSDYDPASVIPAAIEEARDVWNSSSASTGGPGIYICENGSACSGRPSDGKTVTINVVSSACGTPACVPRPSGGWADSDGHLRNMEIKINDLMEIPGNYRWLYDGAETILWTNDEMLHREFNALDRHNRFIYLYLPDTLMHEFGHTFGLFDLYNLADSKASFWAWPPWSGGKYEGYLMDKEAWNKDPVVGAIPGKDSTYIGDVYKNHSAHGP